MSDLLPNEYADWWTNFRDEYWIWAGGREVRVDDGGGHETVAIALLFDERKIAELWKAWLRGLPRLKHEAELLCNLVDRAASSHLGIAGAVRRGELPEEVGRAALGVDYAFVVARGEARRMLMERTGAIRVGGAFETWKLDKERLEAIQDFLLRHARERDVDARAGGSVFVEELSTGRYGDVTMEALLDARQPGQVWRAAGYGVVQAGLHQNPIPSLEPRKELLERWTRLVNLSADAMRAFVRSDWGKQAGLSRAAALAQGIHSGQDSARALIRMLEKSPSDWTAGEWRWAARQVAFIERMRGMPGPLFDDHGRPTRKLTSLWLWGHDPDDASRRIQWKV